MASCPNFPTGKLKTMLEKTAESGKEHAVVKCGDGSTSKVVSGGDSRVNVSDAVEQCDLDDGPVSIAHTHPNGVKELSKQDRQVAASENVESVCVAIEDGEMKCEIIETCESEVEQ